MKIELFSRMVIEKSLSEDRNFLEELNRRHAKILDDMEMKCQKQRVDYLHNIEEKAKEKKRKLIFRTQSEVQKQILVKKNALLKKLKMELMDAIKTATDTENYSVYFQENYSNALKNFEEKDDLVIGIKSRDLAYVSKDIETIIDESILGGFYIIKSGKVKYDYTLNCEVDGIDDYLGCMIGMLFESSGEACNEDE